MGTIGNSDAVPEGGAPIHQGEWDGYDSPSTAVVETVAEATERDEMELDVLHEWVDSDALDAILTHESAESVSVSFTYDDVQVRITASGAIEIW